MLREREMKAGELADCVQLAKPTLAGHFNVLREADLVTSEKSGTTITYRLHVSVLEEALLGSADLVGLVAPTAGRATRKLERRTV